MQRNYKRISMPPNLHFGLLSIKNILSDRIACGPTKNPIKHSKRRRRRRRRQCIEDNCTPPVVPPTTLTTTTIEATTMKIPALQREPSLEKLKTEFTLSLRSCLHGRRRKRMQQFLIFLILLPLLMTTTLAIGASSPCEAHSWWDAVKDKCIKCTVCEGELFPLRPCQLHRDTVCGSIYDLKIDWVVLAKTEPNWKERRKSDGNAYGLSALEHQLAHEELQQLHEDTIPMDWQTAALFMAVLACLLFFIVAACILIHHMRQWRRMERRLDQDVEELSTKLMAKLAEVQNLDGGTFFIGNAEALQVPTRFQPQHVLLPAEKSKKHQHSHLLHHQHHQIRSEHHFLKATQPGNVYIENGSKG